MKHKIYIVHESVDMMGEIRQKMVKAFACKQTARKFINYKNIKLNELKKKFESFDPCAMETYSSKTAENRLKRFKKIYNTNEYFLQEVDLYQ